MPPCMITHAPLSFIWRLKYNEIAAEGAKAIADALLVNASLTALDVRLNDLGNEGKALLQQAVQGRSGFNLLM